MQRWRRSRPYWGGKLLILSALELFFSSNLDPVALDVHIGPSGFLSYVIPAVMLLCGLLAWLSPGQRMFYGILGSLTAVYSLIGLNLGGFFLGALLGIVGGALTAAWSIDPDRPVPEESGDEVTAEQPILAEPVLDGPWPGGPPPDEPPAHGPRVTGAALALLVLAATVVGVANRPTPAAAAPCAPAATSTEAPVSPSASASPSAPKAASKSGPQTSPKPSGDAVKDGEPTPSPSADQHDGNVITDVVDGIVGIVKDIFGDHSRPEASPSAGSPSAPPSSPGSPSGAGTPAPPRTPTRSSTASPKPTTTKATPRSSAPKPCTPSSASASPVPPKRAAAVAGQPHVANKPSLLLTTTQRMSGLSYDGVVDLPTKTPDGEGVIRSLKFTMDTSVSIPFELRTPGDPKNVDTTSDSMTAHGHVSVYTTRFSGKILGVLQATFTPDAPPPLIAPELFFTDCEIELVFLEADTLTAPNFYLRFAT
jgi:hypothetical protein